MLHKLKETYKKCWLKIDINKSSTKQVWIVNKKFDLNIKTVEFICLVSNIHHVWSCQRNTVKAEKQHFCWILCRTVTFFPKQNDKSNIQLSKYIMFYGVET